MNKTITHCYVADWNGGAYEVYNSLEEALCNILNQYLTMYSENTPKEQLWEDILSLAQQHYIDEIVYICEGIYYTSPPNYNPDEVALNQEHKIKLCDYYRETSKYGLCMGQKFTPQVFCNGNKEKCQIVNSSEEVK